jgi:hypothetical protein
MPLAEAATRRGRSTIARNSYGSVGEYQGTVGSSGAITN